MKEILKTALLWAVMICTVPVLLSAGNAVGGTSLLGASGKMTAGEAAYPESTFPEAAGEAQFALETAPVLTVCSEGETCAMPLEEYVFRAVLAQIPGDMEDEALCAQAAAARTYAVRRLLAGKDERGGVSAHIFNDPENYQIWLDDSGIEALYGSIRGDIPNKVQRAVTATAGEIIVCNGSPIIAAFHTANGGMTEAGVNVWGTYEPYLAAVPSPWDISSEYCGVRHYFTSREIYARLSAEYGGVSDFNGIELSELSPSGTVMQLRVCGMEMTGERFAELFSLESSCFTAENDSRGSRITVNGSGHLAGLSMYGADCMAREGADYREILAHYYPGTDLGRLTDEG